MDTVVAMVRYMADFKKIIIINTINSLRVCWPRIQVSDGCSSQAGAPFEALKSYRVVYQTLQ